VLDGKAALVTGSSRGIGRAIAARLAADGAVVGVNFNNRHELADGLVEEFFAAGGRGVAVQADISRPAQVKRLFDETEAALGPLDIVVANAAVLIVKRLEDCSEEDFDFVFDANAKGTFFTLREAARRLREGGRIVVTSTVGTKMLFTDRSLYLASKGATEQFVRSLARELAPRQITVNAVSPGFTDTDLLPEEDWPLAAEMSPFGRIGRPEEVANVVAFLTGGEGGWVTGQNVVAGGGVV
jgi:3-oxoacyl-[acyl-carrier protein] reductase